MVNNGTDTKTVDLRYAKRLGIPMMLKHGHTFISAILTFGTYKQYPLDEWHRELIVSLRYGRSVIDIAMDGTELTLYFTL
jgi:hypothetical protein